MVAQMAAHSLHDRKVVGSNLAGSNCMGFRIPSLSLSPTSSPTSQMRHLVEAHHHVNCPDTGRNSGGRLTIKKNKLWGGMGNGSNSYFM